MPYNNKKEYLKNILITELEAEINTYILGYMRGYVEGLELHKLVKNEGDKKCHMTTNKN